MSTLTTVLLTIVAAETVALVLLAIRYRKAKEAARTRRVEAPNSEFKSPYVQDLEARDRWESMSLDRLHEVNREEVERLLEKVREEGVAELASSEREFLDRMARVADEENQNRGLSGGGPASPREVPGRT